MREEVGGRENEGRGAYLRTSSLRAWGRTRVDRGGVGCGVHRLACLCTSIVCNAGQQEVNARVGEGISKGGKGINEGGEGTAKVPKDR